MKDNMPKLKKENKYIDTFTNYDKNYNYEDEDAEAVIYVINPSGKNRKPNLFVMKRKDAVKFCSRKETKGNNWALCFTTHKRDWRDKLKLFRKDNGKFDELLQELDIELIYRLK